MKRTALDRDLAPYVAEAVTYYRAQVSLHTRRPFVAADYITALGMRYEGYTMEETARAIGRKESTLRDGLVAAQNRLRTFVTLKQAGRL